MCCVYWLTKLLYNCKTQRDGSYQSSKYFLTGCSVPKTLRSHTRVLMILCNFCVSVDKKILFWVLKHNGISSIEVPTFSSSHAAGTKCTVQSCTHWRVQRLGQYCECLINSSHYCITLSSWESTNGLCKSHWINKKKFRIIELFHLPTLMHNSLFINNMYVKLLSSTCFED